MGAIGTIIFIILVIYIIARLMRESEAVGNWSHLFENLNIDTNEFYSSVENILKEKQIPDMKTGRENLSEGSMLSHNREYLKFKRKDYIIHICAAPWGEGSFFSWWLRQELSTTDKVLGAIPFIGQTILKARQYKSYYKLDTDSMFRTSVHQSVMEAIDKLTEAKGVRGLTELERKPDLRSQIHSK